MLEFVLCRSGMGRRDFQWTEDLHCVLRMERDVMEVTAEAVAQRSCGIWAVGEWSSWYRGVVIMAQADCSGLWELENESSEHSHLSCATAGTLSVS